MTDLSRLPLSERLKNAEYLARELSEHLRQSYLPRLAELRNSCRVYDVNRVSDQQMFDQIQEVLKSDEFAQDVYARLSAHLTSVRDEMHHLVLGGDTSPGSGDLTVT